MALWSAALITSGSFGSAVRAQSGTGVPACSARHTSVVYRSARRRSGAVTWAYGAATAACSGCSGTDPSNAVYPAPRISSAAWSRNAAPRGSFGSTAAMTRPALAPGAHVMPSAAAAVRRLSSADCGGGGIVRSRPTLPSSMMRAAAIPVSSEICALKFSTGSGPRSRSAQPPPSTGSTSCAGIGRLMAPRARPRSMSNAPSSGSSAMGSLLTPRSMSA